MFLTCPSVNSHTESGGSGSPSSKLSSLVQARKLLLACQKCQRSQGTGFILPSFSGAHIFCGASKASTVRGIRRVAILVIVIVFEPSHLRYVSKVPTVTPIGRVGVVILITVIVFELSHLLCVSKVSTRIRRVAVASLVALIVLELSLYFACQQWRQSPGSGGSASPSSYL